MDAFNYLKSRTQIGIFFRVCESSGILTCWDNCFHLFRAQLVEVEGKWELTVANISEVIKFFEGVAKKYNEKYPLQKPIEVRVI